MKPKPFNLERALAGEPVISRDERDVIIAGHNPDAINTSQLVGWVGNIPTCWYSNGKCSCYGPDSTHESGNDLFMKPIERTGYICFYKLGDKISSDGIVYNTEQLVLSVAQKDEIVGMITWLE